MPEITFTPRDDDFVEGKNQTTIRGKAEPDPGPKGSLAGEKGDRGNRAQNKNQYTTYGALESALTKKYFTGNKKKFSQSLKAHRIIRNSNNPSLPSKTPTWTDVGETAADETQSWAIEKAAKKVAKKVRGEAGEKLVEKVAGKIFMAYDLLDPTEMADENQDMEKQIAELREFEKFLELTRDMPKTHRVRIMDLDTDNYSRKLP